ncbi:putative exported protein [Yersinia enterocolitica subsp. enterocolitica 8081]|uniref:Exported protein n=2 Tax=Yersinia enterocolitica TaxID=630 RepID=A1JQ62_YERE8|nr:putative exported protein [Yersinia enterocolitica subsp. enterocolitica 8081]
MRNQRVNALFLIMFCVLLAAYPHIGGIMEQYELITPLIPTCIDVECQCRALAYAAYHIDHIEVQELLLFTLIEKQHQLTAMLEAEYKETKGNDIVNMNILGL